jgi:hypothetical protein
MISLQYLEPSPQISLVSPASAADHLQQVCDLLQVDLIILGWDLPAPLVDACARVAAANKAQLYLWYPLLTGSTDAPPPGDWQTLNLEGMPIPGYLDMPEFTFICPNHPAALPWRLERLETSLDNTPFQGVFLDRIRYPSPAQGVDQFFGCFCPHCRQRAASEGLDLLAIQRRIRHLLAESERIPQLVQSLLDPSAPGAGVDKDLLEWFAFRCRSITRAVQAAADAARRQGRQVGLDCFAPCLAAMVGQDISALDQTCDWIKVMTYAHTYAPAGMPFEVLHLLDWLKENGLPIENTLPAWLARSLHFPLTLKIDDLQQRGVPAEAVRFDLERVLAAVEHPLFAGFELVDLPGITRLSSAQIVADLQVLKNLPLAGFTLCWDAWHIPLDWLKLVSFSLS